MPAVQKIRVLLTGGSGQVGSALLPLLREMGEVYAPSHAQLDLGSGQALRDAVRAFEPRLVINAAADTLVDRAEAEPEAARRVNADAPAILAQEAVRRRAILVHYSTDYVFDGSRRSPYKEDDPTGPLNVYGRTKLEGDQGVAAAGGAYFVLRTGWIYASRGRNFLATMLRLGAEREVLRVVDDQVGTPTPAPVVAQATIEILRRCWEQAAGAYEWARGLAGIYHAGCAGQTSWYRFALAIFEEARERGLEARLRVREVVPITSEQFPTAAQRPRYSVLSKEKIQRAFGIQPPDWQEELRRVMQECALAAGREEPVR